MKFPSCQRTEPAVPRRRQAQRRLAARAHFQTAAGWAGPRRSRPFFAPRSVAEIPRDRVRPLDGSFTCRLSDGQGEEFLLGLRQLTENSRRCGSRTRPPHEPERTILAASYASCAGMRRNTLRYCALHVQPMSSQAFGREPHVRRLPCPALRCDKSLGTNRTIDRLSSRTISSLVIPWH